MQIQSIDVRYDNKSRIFYYNLSCSLLNIYKVRCDLFLVDTNTNLKQELIIKHNRAIMEGNLIATDHFFEKFQEFYVRIDILEKLFLKIIENTKDKKFKTNAEMMNLLGCSKENFYKLMNYMNYKKDKLEDTYVFLGEKRKKKKIIRFDKKENPFKKLLSLNLNK